MSLFARAGAACLALLAAVSAGFGSILVEIAAETGDHGASAVCFVGAALLLGMAYLGLVIDGLRRTAAG